MPKKYDVGIVLNWDLKNRVVAWKSKWKINIPFERAPCADQNDKFGLF